MQPTAIQSAETLAALRALAECDRSLVSPCRDAFAKYFLSRKNRLTLDFLPSWLIKGLLRVAAPGGYAFAIARTRHFDETLLTAIGDGAKQVVILGAGYDSRAFRFQHELEGVAVFELDHPGTQARKKALLANAPRELPDNVKLISVDFAKQSFADALAANGFDPAKKTIFLWEGVSYYLPVAAVENVLAFVSNCAKGSAIVFDYAIAKFVNGDTSTYGGRAVARWLKKIGEPFLFGLEPSAALAFLLRQDLRMVAHLGPDDLERRYLQTVDGRDAARTLGHLRIIEARSFGGSR